MDAVPTEMIPAGCTISDAVRAERAAGQDPAQCDAVMAWYQQDKASDRRKVWIFWLEQLAHDQRVAQMAREAALPRRDAARCRIWANKWNNRRAGVSPASYVPMI